MQTEKTTRQISGSRARNNIFLALYLVGLVFVSILVHEAAHVLAALVKGVEFSSLKIGFWGINPSVTLPQGLDESTKTPIFYAGGITAGILLICFYFIYWVKKYRCNPSRLGWALALAPLVLGAEQLATGYLEGRYHSAYLYGATTLFSPTNLFIIVWMSFAVAVHLQLCPRDRLKTLQG
jgi:hypothetical protein